MENPEMSRRPRGRPRKGGKTENVPLKVDEATIRKLDALIEYGGFGTSRQEIVMTILRIWFWDHDTKIKADVASKDAPFGPISSAPK
jgi:hypothetical protein